MKWYIAKCPTGAEANAIKSLQEFLIKANMNDELGEIFIPYSKEKQTQRRNGKSNMANYVFLQMNLNTTLQEIFQKLETMNLMLDEDLNAITTTDEAINAMRLKLDESLKLQEQGFMPGETVKVMEAPFQDFTATIEKVDEAKQIASISVPILGRQISLELPFKSIKRITN
jgi:transcriptional antiterminator NusG